MEASSPQVNLKVTLRKKHQFTIPKRPKQIGVVERFTRTLAEMVRSLLADSELSKSFWAEALVTAVYLQNQSMNKFMEGKTPYEAIDGQMPKVGHLRVFGCTAYSHIHKDKQQKLDAKACNVSFWDILVIERGTDCMIKVSVESFIVEM